VILLDTHVNMYVCRMGGKRPRQGRYRGGIRSLSTLHRPKFLDQQCLGFIQLESVAGGAGEEELALSNKASSLDSIAASRLFSFISCSISFSISLVRRSLSSSLIWASMVGCQLNVANKRRDGGKEERNSDLLINLEVEESDEIDMAVRSEKGDQSHQQPSRQGCPSHGIQRLRTRYSGHAAASKKAPAIAGAQGSGAGGGQ